MRRLSLAPILATLLLLLALAPMPVSSYWWAAAHSTTLSPISVTFDAAGETETHAFDVGSAANRCLTVFVSWRQQTNTITSVSYAGSAMTSAGAAVTNGNLRGHLFQQANPTTGSNNIEVVMGAGAGNSIGQISAHVASGCDISGTAFENFNSNNGVGAGPATASSVTITSAADDLVVVYHATYNEAEVLSATPTNYTERRDVSASNGMNVEFGDAAGASSVATTATWNNGATSTNWVAIGISVNASGGGGGATPCRRALLGVGCAP